jgi:hypothetical protein
LQFLLEPTGESFLHLRQLISKEVIGAANEQQPFGFGGGVHYVRQLRGRRVLILVSAKKELGGGAMGEEWVPVVAGFSLGGQAKGDKGANIGTIVSSFARWPATGFERHSRSKTESSNDEWAIVFVFKPGHGCQYIAGFQCAVMGSLA